MDPKAYFLIFPPAFNRYLGRNIDNEPSYGSQGPFPHVPLRFQWIFEKECTQ